MESVNLIQTWKITTLTPLHIGDGEEMKFNIDYVPSEKGIIDVIEQDDIIDLLITIPDIADKVRGLEYDLRKIIKDFGISVTPIYRLKYHGTSIPDTVRRFIKNAHQKPYIPGSSLKGAIRTAIWCSDYLDKSNLFPIKDYDIFEKKVKKLSGKDPQHDFLRPLHISDSIPLEPDDVLHVEEIKIFNLMHGNMPGWKDVKTRKTKNDHNESSGLFIEAIKEGVATYIEASLERFLGKEIIKKAGELPDSTISEGFPFIAQKINQHSRDLAQKELQYLKRFLPVTSPVVNFYNALINKINSLSNGSFIIRIAWGGGWRAMTGNWLEGEVLQLVRRVRHLGRKGFPFPKTRRLILKDGIPSIPPGWLKIEPVTDMSFKEKAMIPYEVIKLKKEPVPEEISRKSVEIVKKEKIEDFKDKLSRTKNIAGEIDSFIQIINTQEEHDIQKDMCKLLINKAKRDKKGFKRAIKDEKAWAKKLKALCDELGVEV